MTFYDEAVAALSTLVRALHGDPRNGWRQPPKNAYIPPTQQSRHYLSNRRKISPCNRRTTA